MSCKFFLYKGMGRKAESGHPWIYTTEIEGYDGTYENGDIIAFLGRYGFGSSVEICGMVAPAYRNQGIFSRLLKKALSPDQLHRYNTVLLNTPNNSLTGLAFMESIPARLSSTEHQMKFNPNLGGVDEQSRSTPAIELRAATQEDLESIISLDMDGFNQSLEDASEMAQRMMEESGSTTYMVLQNERAVGKLRVTQENEEAWVYGFVIQSGLRGQGVGRAALMKVIELVQADGKDVFIEVAADNDRALHLYTSCGFETFQAQQYYTYQKIAD